MSQRHGLGIVVVVMTMVLIASSAFAAQSPSASLKPMRLTVVVGPSVSVVYAYWVGVTRAIRKVYPQLEFTVMEASGGLDGVKKVRSGQADFSNTTADLTWTSFNGEESFKGQPLKDGRVLWCYDLWTYQWAVAKASGVKSLDGLKDKPFNPGPAGSAMSALAKSLFKEYGIEARIHDATAAAASEAMQNRQIIGVGKLGPIPDSYLQQIATTIPLNIVGLTKDQQKKLTDKYAYFLPVTVPAKAYGESDEALTVAVVMGGFATTSLPQEAGYAFFKAMWEGGKGEWQAALPQAKDNNIPELTLKSANLLHAGTVQYLQEKGLKVPERLIPPEYKPVK